MRQDRRPPSPTVTPVPAPKLTNANGSPATSNPSYALSIPGPAQVGVPNFFIDKFRIPPFLLPIYQAAGMQYGIRWEVLAGINEIETDYGRNLNVSSAGAVGWMQFMPATWKMYGVDANQDGVKDPFNPVDAIFAAARYLKAAGGDKDIRKGVFAYNHADWYVDWVLMRAQVIGGIPGDLIGSLTGLTQGRFPVRAKATYAGALKKADRKIKGANAAVVVQSDETRKNIEIYAAAGSPVIAVNDGKVVSIGVSQRLGHYVILQDVYGNTYTYGHLGTVAKTFPSPKHRSSKAESKPATARRAAAACPPRAPRPSTSPRPTRSDAEGHRPATAPARRQGPPLRPPEPQERPRQRRRLAAREHRDRLDLRPARPQPEGLRVQAVRQGRPRPRRHDARPHRQDRPPRPRTCSSRSARPARAPRASTRSRSSTAGSCSSRPRSTAPRARTRSSAPTRRAEHRPDHADEQGEPRPPRARRQPHHDLRLRRGHPLRRDRPPRAGHARVPRDSGLKPAVSSLKCGHGYLTTSGNVSEHTTGTAVDIASINGINIYGHQGPGSIADITIQRLLTLQGTMKPHQIISLMTFAGADNTLAMADHADHIHVGWRPLYGDNKEAAKQINAILKPKQWIKLIDRLGEISNPKVSAQPSKYAVKVKGSSD